MKKGGGFLTALLCAIVVIAGTMAYAWKGGVEAAEPTKHLTPTKLVMQVISSHTANMMDALFKGNVEDVVKEANSLAMNSQNVMDNFFPSEGKVGKWLEGAGRNANDPVAVKTAKEEFEKHLMHTINAAKDIATTAKTEDIVKTFDSFNNKLMKSCFDCHKAFRPKWPEWGDWMSIAGG